MHRLLSSCNEESKCQHILEKLEHSKNSSVRNLVTLAAQIARTQPEEEEPGHGYWSNPEDQVCLLYID